jgi:hypothetical protein
MTMKDAEQVPAPECAKLVLVKDKSHTIGEFLDWVQAHAELSLARFDRDGRWMPIRITSILAEYFDIDLAKVEAEKQAILEAIRK